MAQWCAADTDLGFTRDRRSNARKLGEPDLRGPPGSVAVPDQQRIAPLRFALRCVRDTTPIPLRPFGGYDVGMDESEQQNQDKYVETARERRIANALLLFFLVVVVGGGIWLANAMFEQRRLDDCMAQGRANCAPPIEAPAR
jgi:hypothetical protein